MRISGKTGIGPGQGCVTLQRMGDCPWVKGVPRGAMQGWGPGGTRPGTTERARFKMRRMTFISRCLLRMRSRDFHTGGGGGWEIPFSGVWKARRGGGVDGRGTMRHVSTVGNGFLRRRNVCYSFFGYNFCFNYDYLLPARSPHPCLPNPASTAFAWTVTLLAESPAPNKFVDVFWWLSVLLIRGQCWQATPPRPKEFLDLINI